MKYKIKKLREVISKNAKKRKNKQLLIKIPKLTSI